MSAQEPTVDPRIDDGRRTVAALRGATRGARLSKTSAEGIVAYVDLLERRCETYRQWACEDSA